MKEHPVSNISLDEIKVKVTETQKNPNIGKTHQVFLKEGPRTFKLATIFEILAPSRNALHHLSLQIDTLSHTKLGWFQKLTGQIRLEGEEPNEIKKLSSFLNAILRDHYPDEAGEFCVVSAQTFKNIEEILRILPQVKTKDRLRMATEILANIDSSTIELTEVVDIFKKSSPDALRNIAVASRYVEYKAALQEFNKLVETSDIGEPEIQKHLQANPWLFGSEYSELLDRRTWSRDNKMDFMLRRTVDGFLEIIEIKTPFKDSLLKYDSSHDSYYPSSKLSQVIGQIMGYIEEVERGRDFIIAKDNSDPLKIRARIIIGRDGDQAHQKALRNLNAHLHRIEIFTFDQLVRVGNRVLAIFEEKLKHEKIIDED